MDSYEEEIEQQKQHQLEIARQKAALEASLEEDEIVREDFEEPEGQIVSLSDPDLPEGELQRGALTDYEQKWLNLIKYVKANFYDPDIEAMRIVFSCYAAHIDLDEKQPAWLFIIGPSGTGKTELCMNPLYKLSQSREVDDITEATFMSGFGDKNGLLNEINKNNSGNAILLFPDFTTILSKDESALKMLLGQLRRMYDGRSSKTFGNKEESTKWAGKITCIAACTPAIEEIWSKYREFGERFLSVRWREPRDIKKALAKSDDNSRNSYAITAEFRRLTEDLIDPVNLNGFKPTLTKVQSETLHVLAILVSRLQTTINYNFKGQISYVGVPNFPMRINACIRQIAKGSAMLDRRMEIDDDDMKLAARVAFDSIPTERRVAIMAIISDIKNMIVVDDMKKLYLKQFKVNSVYSKNIKELKILGVIKKTFYSTGSDYYEFTDEIKEIIGEISFIDEEI